MRSWVGGATLFLSWGALPSSCPAQQPGDTVVVISPRANIPLGDRGGGVAYLGAMLAVRKIQDEWLSVSQGTPGWILREDVMLLDPAVDYFSGIIRRNPKDAVAYFVRGNIRSEQGEF